MILRTQGHDLLPAGSGDVSSTYEQLVPSACKERSTGGRLLRRDLRMKDQGQPAALSVPGGWRWMALEMGETVEIMAR